MASSKIFSSWYSRSLLSYHFSISEYQIDCPYSDVGYISFNFYVSLVLEALGGEGYLETNNLVSHQKFDLFSLQWPLVKLGFFTLEEMCTSQRGFTFKISPY